MTCHELHSYFEGCVQDGSRLTPEAASHLQACAACRAFVDGQQELGRSLRVVRESVPAMSEALDAAVLARYRQRIAEKRGHSTHWPSPWALGWGLAAAMAIIAVSMFWLLTTRTRTTATQAISPKPAVVQAPTAAASHTAAGNATVPAQHVRHASKPRRTGKALEPSVVSSAPRVPRLPERFRSLMFCDELSCVGDMDIVRVQLPSAFVPRAVSALPQPTGFVNADVLVGADGIARGIRVEQ